MGGRSALALAFVMLAPSAAAVLALPPLGEYPADFSCDSSARRVCAGIDAGAWAECVAADANTSARCSWSYGWISRAWSAQAESGNETHSGNVSVLQCSSVTGCVEIGASEFASSCAWLAVLSCDDSRGPFGGNVTVPVAMGECLTLRVPITGAIDAQVPARPLPGAPEPAQAHWEHEEEGAGEWCRVDDGRG